MINNSRMFQDIYSKDGEASCLEISIFHKTATSFAVCLTDLTKCFQQPRAHPSDRSLLHTLANRGI